MTETEKTTEATAKPLWTRATTADFFEVSEKTIDNWARDGVLSPLRIGGRVYYTKISIEALVRQTAE